MPSPSAGSRCSRSMRDETLRGLTLLTKPAPQTTPNWTASRESWRVLWPGNPAYMMPWRSRGRSVDLLDLARRDHEGGDVHGEVDIDTAGIPIERGRRRALSACETDGRLAVLLAMLAPAPRALR